MNNADAYCTKCGNTGVDIDGNVCSCRFDTESFYESVTCMSVPEQYQGIYFNKILVTPDMPEAYGHFLESVFNDIKDGRWKFKNIAICSPASTSKTILAYSCLQSLFRKGLQTFPVYDVMELKKIMYDLDMGKKLTYEVDNPTYLMTCPYLFARVPNNLSREVYDTMYTLVERRVRRGNSTIFLYNGTWEDMTRIDYNSVVKGMLGNGTFTSIESKVWYKKKKETVVEDTNTQGDN